jgi:hypothetical protein
MNAQGRMRVFFQVLAEHGIDEAKARRWLPDWWDDDIAAISVGMSEAESHAARLFDVPIAEFTRARKNAELREDVNRDSAMAASSQRGHFDTPGHARGGVMAGGTGFAAELERWHPGADSGFNIAADVDWTAIERGLVAWLGTIPDDALRSLAEEPDDAALRRHAQSEIEIRHRKRLGARWPRGGAEEEG